MGYRSEITAVFYAHGADEWPLIKLFFAENFPKDWVENLEEVHHGNRSGFMLRVSDTKWYESFPEVREFEEFEEKFKEMEKCGDGTWACEFVRIGEDYTDIETRSSDHAAYILDVKRYAELEF
jgi:hypothetical protein